MRRNECCDGARWHTFLPVLYYVKPSSGSGVPNAICHTPRMGRVSRLVEVDSEARETLCTDRSGKRRPRRDHNRYLAGSAVRHRHRFQHMRRDAYDGLARSIRQSLGNRGASATAGQGSCGWRRSACPPVIRRLQDILRVIPQTLDHFRTVWFRQLTGRGGSQEKQRVEPLGPDFGVTQCPKGTSGSTRRQALRLSASC